MKKKLLALLVAFVAMFTCSFTFAACKDGSTTENETDNTVTENGGETEDQAVEMTKDELKKALEDTLELKNVTLTRISDNTCGAIEIDLTDAVVYYSAFETTDNTIIEEGYTSDNKDYKKTDNLWQIQPQSTMLNEAEQVMKSPILDVIYYFDELEWSWNGEVNVYTFSYYTSFNQLFMGDISFSGGFVKKINLSWAFNEETYREESYLYDKINSTTVTEPEDLFGYSKDGKIYVTVRYPNGTPVNGLNEDGWNDAFSTFPAVIGIQIAFVSEDGSLGPYMSPVNLNENGQATLDINYIIESMVATGAVAFEVHVLHVQYLGYVKGEEGEYGIFTEDTAPQNLFITLIEA